MKYKDVKIQITIPTDATIATGYIVSTIAEILEGGLQESSYDDPTPAQLIGCDETTISLEAKGIPTHEICL